MKNILVLFLLCALYSCSSADYSSEDFSHGRYKFSMLFHKEYLKFVKDHILAGGSSTFAGPKFENFNNYQKINVLGLSPSNQMSNTIHTAKDGTQHSYTHYHMVESLTTPQHYYFDLEIQGEHLGYTASTKIRVQVKITCKKDIKCEPGLAIPSISHNEPFDFEWEIMDKGWIVTEKPDLKQFTDFEQMAIFQRQLFVGMSEAAVKLAIGDPNRPTGYFDNIVIENGILKHFTVRSDYARSIYNFY